AGKGRRIVTGQVPGPGSTRACFTSGEPPLRRHRRRSGTITRALPRSSNVGHSPPPPLAARAPRLSVHAADLEVLEVDGGLIVAPIVRVGHEESGFAPTSRIRINASGGGGGGGGEGAVDPEFERDPGAVHVHVAQRLNPVRTMRL